MKVIIVGGVAGGASTAARLRRLDESAQIILFEKGKYISFANCGMPYYVGGVITDRDYLLVQTVEGMSSRFNLDIRVCSEVVSIDRENKKVHVAGPDGEYDESYDKLVLATGAVPVVPKVAGTDLPGVFVLHDLNDTFKIRDNVKKDGKAVVVGGGFIGLELAENLVHAGMKVTMLEFAQQVMPPLDPEMAVMLEKELKSNGVNLQLGDGLSAIEKDGGALKVVSSSGNKIEADMVLLCVGVRAEDKLAADAGLEVLPKGGIVVNEHMQTSDPDIYAIGDAATKYNYVTGQVGMLQLAGPANRQGRLTADNLEGRGSVFRGVQGTSVVKVFSLTAACTGVNEKTLKAEGVQDYEKIYIHPFSHADYYPGGVQITLKLLFSTKDGKVLGAQCVGQDGVDKRIDVIATAIAMGATVYDLEQLELCYAPPFGSAKDPVNVAGFVAASVLKGDTAVFHLDDPVFKDEDAFLVDVRGADEFAEGTFPNAINIPLDEIRSRLNEFPKDKKIYVFCRVGLRGYLAERILRGHGFTNTANLTGGYLLYEKTSK